MSHPTVVPSRVMRLVALVAVACLAVAFVPAGSSAQPPPRAPLLDLAALTLQPAELEAEGLAGFGLSWSWSFLTIEEALAGTYAESRGGVVLTDIPGSDAILRDAGWQRFHETTLGRPLPDDPENFASFTVSSSIEEYATADGAAAAFRAFTELSALNAALVGEIQLRSDAPPLGDQSVMWATAGVAQDTGTPTTVLTRMVRLGTRIVSVNMVDFVESTPIDPAVLDRLTGRVVDRVARAGALAQPCPPAGPTGLRAAIVERAGVHLPGLSTCVLGLVNTDITPHYAYYTVLDGTVIPLLLDTPEEVLERQETTDTLGLRDTYRRQYIIERGNQAAFFYVTVERYADEAAATAAFDGLEERLRANTSTTLGSFERGVPVIGDASATYHWTTNATGYAVTNSATRMKDLVVTVRVSQTVTPLPAVTQSMLLAQVACMTAGDCSQPLPVPPEIEAAMPVS